ncbi:MAG TPA: antibiotic biosynthesis monooxygenase family protein [Candidatus Sulfotelmatobacter sp.]|nr:antibiotic biosynthesis monooxygenase family protein [Candidatus Sulfotelmatobacter sp.]
MIACIIEFGVRPGMEAEHQRLLTQLMAKVATIDGFISKEAFQSRSDPAKVITISMWRDADALARWNADPDHKTAMAAGKAIFGHYRIQIAEIQRDYGHGLG